MLVLTRAAALLDQKKLFLMLTQLLLLQTANKPSWLPLLKVQSQLQLKLTLWSSNSILVVSSTANHVELNLTTVLPLLDMAMKLAKTTTL